MQRTLSKTLWRGRHAASSIPTPLDKATHHGLQTFTGRAVSVVQGGSSERDAQPRDRKRHVICVWGALGPAATSIVDIFDIKDYFPARAAHRELRARVARSLLKLFGTGSAVMTMPTGQQYVRPGPFEADDTLTWRGRCGGRASFGERRSWFQGNGSWKKRHLA